MAFASAPALVLLLALLEPPEPAERGGQNPAWLERLDEQDRNCLNRGVGFAPPAFPADLVWFNTPPLKWQELRGKVVVVQSWSSDSASGRNWASRAEETFAGNDGVMLIALHTPKGAQGAAAYLERRALKSPIALDPRGTFCDQLGAYERAINVVVDRSGVVRYAGLTTQGLRSAVAALLKETYDPTAAAPARPAETEQPAAAFPPVTGSPGSAREVRGKPAPELNVKEWMNGAAPKTAGRVVVVDFWATWCGPCRMSIPHVNELATTFGDEVVFIGISDEDRSRFLNGLTKYKLNPNSFRYRLGIDPASQASGKLGINAIPYAIVMSSDGVVRWQGHPMGLDSKTLRQIVQADQALRGGAVTCRRWSAR